MVAGAELQGPGPKGFAESVLVDHTLDMLQGNLEIFHRDARRETRIYDEVVSHNWFVRPELCDAPLKV